MIGTARAIARFYEGPVTLRSMRALLLPALALLALPLAADEPPQGHEHHGAVQHRFDDAERWAKVFDEPGRDAWQRPDEVMQVAGVKPGMVVADLGAGTGYFLPHLSRAVGPSGIVLGLDVETSMVAYMTQRAGKAGLVNMLARVVPTDDPLLPAGRVDRVLIVDTWHHVGDRTAYGRKLAAGLASGGSVVVVDFTLTTSKGPRKEHRLAPAAVVAELAAAGLDARIAEEDLPDQYVVIATKR